MKAASPGQQLKSTQPCQRACEHAYRMPHGAGDREADKNHLFKARVKRRTIAMIMGHGPVSQSEACALAAQASS